MGTRRGGDNDVVFGAYVDDNTLQFFQQFDSNVRKLDQTAQQGFDNVEQAIDDAGIQIGVLSGLVSTLTTKLLNMGIRGLQGIKAFIQGSIQLTARADTLATTLELIGEKTGNSREEMMAFEEEVKGMGITTVAARTALIRMARANIDLAEAAKLARIAQNSAVVAGINSSQAFERLVLGIQKQEPELLDELGITLRRTDAYKALADELGKTTKELSLAEKQQAILNEIYRQSGLVTGAYESAQETAGKQAASLARHYEELQLAIGRAFQPAYAQQIQFQTEVLKELKEWFEENEEQLVEFSEVLGNLAESLFNFLHGVLDFASKLPGFIKDAGVGLARAVNSVANIMEDDELEESSNRMYTTWVQLMAIFAASAHGMATIFIETFKIILDGAKVLGDQVGMVFKFMNAVIRGEGERAQELMDDIFDPSEITEYSQRSEEAWDGILQKASDASSQAALSVAHNFGIIEDESDQMAESVEDDMENIADAADEAARSALLSFRSFFTGLGAIRDEYMEGQAGRLRKELYERTKDMLQHRHRLEDIQESYTEAISNISENAGKAFAKLSERQQNDIVTFHQEIADRRASLTDNHNKQLLAIEERYVQQRKRILEDAAYDLEDASGSRDAVAIARIRRQRRRDLKRAKDERDQDVAEERDSYKERQDALEDWIKERQKELKEQHKEELDQLKESIKEQEEAAEAARDKALENLRKSRERQRELQRLQDAYEAQERQLALSEKVQEFISANNEIEGSTSSVIDTMLGEWAGFFSSAISLFKTKGKEMQDAFPDVYSGPYGDPYVYEDPGDATTGPLEQNYTEEPTPEVNRIYIQLPGGGRIDVTDWLPSFVESTLKKVWGADWKIYIPPQLEGVIGQAGQISQQLASFGGMSAPTVNINSPYFQQGAGSRLPAVSPTTSREVREIRVTGDISGLEPQLQRVLINSLIEIERNRSG